MKKLNRTTQTQQATKLAELATTARGSEFWEALRYWDGSKYSNTYTPETLAEMVEILEENETKASPELLAELIKINAINISEIIKRIGNYSSDEIETIAKGFGRGSGIEFAHLVETFGHFSEWEHIEIITAIKMEIYDTYEGAELCEAFENIITTVSELNFYGIISNETEEKTIINIKNEINFINMEETKNDIKKVEQKQKQKEIKNSSQCGTTLTSAIKAQYEKITGQHNKNIFLSTSLNQIEKHEESAKKGYKKLSKEITRKLRTPRSELKLASEVLTIWNQCDQSNPTELEAAGSKAAAEVIELHRGNIEKLTAVREQAKAIKDNRLKELKNCRQYIKALAISNA